MFTAALSKDTAASLALLGKTKLLDKAYLAGGTTCALWLGHRISYDLDFFTPIKFRLDLMAQKLVNLKNFKLRETSWGTILGNFKEIDFSLFYYQYPLLRPTTKFKGINLASLEDIAAMKIAAISDRGTKRDFIDLYFISQQIELADMLKLYDRKFKTLASNMVHILKSLVFFQDADTNEMPKMLKNADWREVKIFFADKVKEIQMNPLTAIKLSKKYDCGKNEEKKAI